MADGNRTRRIAGKGGLHVAGVSKGDGINNDIFIFCLRGKRGRRRSHCVVFVTLVMR